MNSELQRKGKAAKEAARTLAKLDTATKDRALAVIADTIMEQEPNILAANDKDIEAGRENGLSEALLDRLLLTAPRLSKIAADVKSIINLPSLLPLYPPPPPFPPPPSGASSPSSMLL